MPELNLNYAPLPPWLQNDAQESHFLQDAMRGAQIQEQKEMLPLKVQAAQQDIELNRLKQQEFLKQREDRLRAEAAMQQIGTQVAPLFEAGQPMEAFKLLGAGLMRNPIVGRLPAFHDLMQQVDTAVKTDLGLKQMDAALERARIMSDTRGPAVAQLERIMQARLAEGVDPNDPEIKHYQDAISKASTQKQSETETEINNQLEDEKQLAEQAGKPLSDTDILKRRAELRMTRAFKPGMRAHLSYDEQGRPILDLGQGEPTVGTQTAIQTQLANLQNSVTQLKSIDLREKDVGVAGTIWDGVLNRYVAQVAPELADPSVSGNRAQLATAVERFLQAQQSQGRLSAGERAELRDALVTRKLGESLPRAQQVLGVMTRTQQLQAISIAKAAQQPLRDWMFNGLRADDIKSLMKTGDLSLDEASQWLLKLFPKAAGASTPSSEPPVMPQALGVPSSNFNRQFDVNAP